MDREWVAGRFRITGPLARGNMGEVHRAVDTLDLGRPEAAAPAEVAVKRILRRRSGAPLAPEDKSVKRFRREVDIMRRFSHPRIPGVIAGGVDTAGGDYQPYLAMELLDGRPLDQLADEVPQLPVSWVASIGAQIADALYAAHAEGVVHRDLKPANVMLTRGGLVKVLDFGMGLIVDDADETKLTSTGTTVGSVRYMAPEQFAGGRVTRAADLYALGCILYELLVGTPLFDEVSPFELAQKHRYTPPPAMSPPRNDLPDDLAYLVQQLLNKDPAERPGDTAWVRATLNAVVDRAVRDGDDGRSVTGWDAFDPRERLPEPTPAPLLRDRAAASTGEAPLGVMDVFGLHDKLIEEYRAFTEGGVIIRDDAIASFLREDLDAKSQWPDPWLSLNPFFASGGSVSELHSEGLLHREAVQIFQRNKTPGGTVCDGKPLTFHRHQREAIEAARSGESYVLTTGTGSGKSLSYIVPIVDRVLRERDRERSAGTREKRVRAIVVYPMNALANSQVKELEKFLQHGYGKGAEPVTFARYTGQETDDERRRITNDPPDILLTNYVMLELMLTRPAERAGLIRMARGLEFLVFDELHTYRGRQGADVALLIRRVRQACQAPDVQCVGTSATMSSEGTDADQRGTVARVASSIFGTEVRPERVITETLVRATAPGHVDVPPERVVPGAEPRAYNDLYQDPLARWIETVFGLATAADGRLVRQTPTTVEAAAETLARETGVHKDQCVAAIRRTLEAGAEASQEMNRRPLFAFRLHQFISKGDTVHATLEAPHKRFLTREYQLERPGFDGHSLYPLSFCRDCGQEYLTVWRKRKDSSNVYLARRDTTPVVESDGAEEETRDAAMGYLYIDPEHPWPKTLPQVMESGRLPESWQELDEHQQPSVKKSRRDLVPVPVTVDVTGAEDASGVEAAFIPAPFRFCLHCGVSFETKRTHKDFTQLARLDQEGRSSATSLLSGTVVRVLKSLPAEALSADARKLLTFVDNRQDASLQAGHFNDFVQVVELRSALYRAMESAGSEGITQEHLAERVTRALALGPADYMRSPSEAPRAQQTAATALRDVVSFRLLVDLQRGWRVTMPNLEQTGLLRVDYADLEWTAQHPDLWENALPELRSAGAEVRARILRALMDEMRRNLAIDTPAFRDESFESLAAASENRLSEAWVVSRSDQPRPPIAYPRPGGKDARSGLFLSGRGKFANYLARTHPPFRNLSTDDRQKAIVDLLRALEQGNLVSRVSESPHRPQYRRRFSEPEAGYQIDPGCLIWFAGDGVQGALDPVSRTYTSGEGPAVNRFFRDLYRGTARSLAGLVAREHTAQVTPEERETREEDFSDARLRLLYCSPTMELGVDIKGLNAVMMRNVPPTPANYAQRSGRAGRDGQPALVLTYCATGNSHDQYYFRRSELMVSGVVQAPRLDLANEDLVRAHLQAIWLAETGLLLGRAIPEVVDINYDETQRVPAPGLALHSHVKTAAADEGAQRRAVAAARTVFKDVVPQLQKMPWWDETWLERTIKAAPQQFDNAFDRWRELLRAALVDQAEQNRRVLAKDPTERDKLRATARRREAETQIALLKNASRDSRTLLSDFGPYRYLASEGFLPGYSFPRLPLAAYIPTRRPRSDDGDFLQRPRFVAVREFGPGALIYHEGSRYQVTRAQLPPEESGDMSVSQAVRCDQCGYHHPAKRNADLCELCNHPLPAATTGLLQLHTVYTTKRERISSDEEERRRAGFRLATSYRFQDLKERLDRQDADVKDGQGRVARLHYGDSAEVRITNMGRMRTKRDEQDGFWIDPSNGKWLSLKEADQRAGDGSEISLTGDDDSWQGPRELVIPFVSDRRNIAVLHFDTAVRKGTALSLMYALERGIEAAFELEDSELTSELLPPERGPRDKMLFTEAAEGGAGVLRQLLAEPGNLAKAARTALEICHMHPDGTDLDAADSATVVCTRGCYRCLLTYNNQVHHQLIDRRTIRELLVRLAGSETLTTGQSPSRTDQMETLQFGSDTRLEQRFIAFLKEGGYRLPDEAQVLVAEATARPDFIYRHMGTSAAVFIDGPIHDDPYITQRDDDAGYRLDDIGWEVVRIAYDEDWTTAVARFTHIFGPGTQGRR